MIVFDSETMLKKLVIIVLVIVILGGGLAILVVRNNKGKQVTSEVQIQKATLTIDGNSYDISGYIGKTALDATLFATKGKVNMSGSGVNAYVTGINGRMAESAKHEFWELDVNGKQSEVGAGSYKIINNDQIEWKISNY